MSKSQQIKNGAAKQYYEIRYRSAKTGQFVAVPKVSKKAPHDVVKERYGNAIKRLGAT